MTRVVLRKKKARLKRGEVVMAREPLGEIEPWRLYVLMTDPDDPLVFVSRASLSIGGSIVPSERGELVRRQDLHRLRSFGMVVRLPEV
jgi:hypothetical protein